MMRPLCGSCKTPSQTIMKTIGNLLGYIRILFIHQSGFTFLRQLWFLIHVRLSVDISWCEGD